MINKPEIGIDFVGFPKGWLGVGEQLRGIIRLAQINGYDINIIDCYDKRDKFLNHEREFDRYISNEFKNNIRIFSATHNHIAALLWRYGFQYFNCKTNIFHLAWEFSSISPELKPVIGLCDDVWGISKFTAQAFSNDYGVPVGVMSNSVEIGEDNNLGRDYFGLPSDIFLFCSSLDINSFIERKNPSLVIEAFKDAFTHERDVALVLKISNADEKNSEYRNLLRQIKSIKNIILFDSVMTKREVLSLFNSCDSYISLHRSEGFGLGIAENMLLGKPVICTGYSGNMDFCTKETSFLVDYSLIPVLEGIYPHADGLLWADPNKKSAIEAIQKVYYQKLLSLKIGLLAKEKIEKEFSTKGLAKIFKNKIDAIANKK